MKFTRWLTGFTLLELLIAISIAGLALAVAAPASYKMYQSMQFREAVRDVRRTLESARYAAIVSGSPESVVIKPRLRSVVFGEELEVILPEYIELETEAAAELSTADDEAVIQFYGDGSSSGGTIRIGRNDRWFNLHVNWLLGRVEQTVDTI